MISRRITPNRPGRRYLTAFAATGLLAGLLLADGTALAVHDEAVFQLDGNANTATQSNPTALEDWDLICKANSIQIGTLAAAATSGATSISVTETKAPTIVPFNIQIDSEQLTVTARTGTSNPRTYTVSRGFNGTTAAAHASGAVVKGGCLFNSGYTVPSGTTKASPSTFIVDPSTSATDDILKGGTKDDNDITSWAWTSAKPSPPKNDITDGYAAEYTCRGSEPNSVSTCSGTIGDKLLYFGGDRYSINGVANIAFWFFQHSVAQNPNAANGQCTISSGCNFVDKAGNPATHKVGNVSLGGSKGTGCQPGHDPTNICTPGDILVISAFGPHALINVYEWVGAGNATKDYLGTNSCFTAACSLQPILVGGQECGTTTNDNACAIANSSSTTSPWPLPQAAGGNNQFSADAVHGSSAFFEGGLNLTGLGLGGACFSSFLINTRASAAGDAELHDKVMGQFQRCAPSLSTQASTNGTVQPGTPVHDTATVTVTGAQTPDDATGTIDFFLCGPNATQAPDCSTGGTPAGAGIALADTSDPANTHDGVSGANSSNVNTQASPLGNGYYCFRAETHLTNYDNPDPATNTTTECFRVLKLNTSLVTDPQTCSGNPLVCVTNHGPFLKANNTQVYDHAVITGDAADGFPDGSVKFFICNPTQVTGSSGAEVCAAGAGTQVGGSVNTTHVANETIKTEATSDTAVTANQIGVWCFRAEFTSSTAVYNDTSGGDHGECFTVTTTTSLVTDPQTCSGDPLVCVTNHGPFLKADNSQVYDHAVITGDPGDGFPTGNVTFYICDPTQVTGAAGSEICPSNAGTQVGGVVSTSNIANSSPHKTEATSDTAVTANQVGVWCFRASFASSNPLYGDTSGGDHGECFTVRTTTSLVTDPQTCSGDPLVCVTNHGPFSLADNSQVVDHAVITGDTGDGFPTGNVTFYVCNPSQVTGAAGSEICPSNAGTQVGTAVATTNIANSSPHKTEATSNAAVTANQLGVWCFRASFASTNPLYLDTSGGDHGECFTVTTTSSGTSNQKWLPNDHVVVSTATGTLAGRLQIQLLQGTLGASCATSTGTVTYTEPVPNNGAFTATAAGAAYNTTNSNFTVNLTPDNNTGDYFWRIVFTPGTFSGNPAVFTPNSYATGFTKCETSSVTINDNP